MAKPARSRQSKKKKIGISLDVNSLTRLWDNGLFQNVFTVFTILKNSGKYEPYILCTHENNKVNIDKMIAFEKAYPDMKTTSIEDYLSGVQKLDMIIEAGTSYRKATHEAFKLKNKKLKVVSLVYGNLYFVMAEKLVDKRDEETLITVFDYPRDAVWASEHFSDTFEWLRISKGAPIIRIAPYIWSHRYLDKSISDLGLKNSDLLPKSRMHVAVLEPNINLIKNCMISVTIAELLHRKNKGVLEKCRIFNSTSVMKHSIANSVMSHLTVVQDRVVTFENNYRFANIFANHADVLLSNQHMNALNYIYLEAMYLGIPLVHNSHFFKDVGYYYEGFDIEGGAKALEAAIMDKGVFGHSYKEASKEYIWKHSPENPININGYIDLVDEVFSR